MIVKGDDIEVPYYLVIGQLEGGGQALVLSLDGILSICPFKPFTFEKNNTITLEVNDAPKVLQVPGHCDSRCPLFEYINKTSVKLYCGKGRSIKISPHPNETSEPVN